MAGSDSPLDAPSQQDRIDPDSPFIHATEFWHELDDGRIQCDVCPRECKLRVGQRGLCFVRANLDNAMIGNHVVYNGNFETISIGDYSVLE